MKRLISAALALCMAISLLFCFSLPVSATNRTVQQALSWCASLVGKYYDYDGVYGPQCVDLIYGYYNYLGVAPVGGNGIDYTWKPLPAGWQRIQGAAPQPGDILVYTNGTYGHVAIYGSSSVIYHIRPSYSKYVLAESTPYHLFPNYWGVIRPNFSSAPAANVLTASNIVYPININKGAPDNGYFTVNGTITSPNTIKIAEVMICDTSMKPLYWDGVYEPGGARTYYDLHDSDQKLCFSKLPVGSYYYVVWGRDVKGYQFRLEYPFTVSYSATSRGTTATKTAKHMCDDCGTWGVGVITRSASCTKVGIRTYTCTVCGATKTQEIAKKSHSFYKSGNEEPSCTEDVWARYTCSGCGSNELRLLKATGHNYVDGVCTRCGFHLDDLLDDVYDVYSEFPDIWQVGTWAHESIEFVCRNGYFSGMGNGEFAPNRTMTRAMLVTVLYNYAGPLEGGKTYENPFSDVKQGDWFYKAVTWAAEKGIVAGIGEGKFAPNEKVTREQIAAIFYRFDQWMGEKYNGGAGYRKDLGRRAELSAFPDAAQVSAWAADAMSWAVANELISGSKEGDAVYLCPRNDATRAQVACIFDRYLR